MAARCFPTQRQGQSREGETMLFLAKLEREGEGSRARIMDLLRRHPGMNKTRLCKEVGLSWATTTYHLKRLQHQGAVDLQHRGKRDVLCFPVSVSPKDRAWLATLHDPTAAAALGAIGVGRAGVRELSKRIGLSESAARRRLERMHADGVLTKRGVLRPVYSRNTDAAPNEKVEDAPPSLRP